MESLIYLFALTEAVGEDTDSGELQTFTSSGITAHYSIEKNGDFQPEIFNEKIKDYAWVQEKVKHHDDVIHQIHFQQKSCIPAKFPSIFSSKAMLSEYLAEHHASLLPLLQKLDDQNEWMLKLTYKPEEVADYLAQKPTDSAKENSGKAYLQSRLAAKQSENQTADFLAKSREKWKEQLEAAFVTTHLPLPKQRLHHDEHMLQKTAILVDKANKADDILEKLNALNFFEEKSGLYTVINGPLAPYNFC